jgi:fimbrial chaperone protein
MMQHRNMLAVFLAAACLAAAPGAPQAAGTTFTVDPTQIVLSSATSSVMLTLRNDSQETLRFQLSAFAWNQAPSGEMQLGATEDVVFFPSLVSLNAGDTRRVRVGRATTPAAREKTYRIFVEELPPVEVTGAGIRVLTRMGIPIFVRPKKDVVAASIENMHHEADRLLFSLANTGTVHFVPQAIRVTASAESKTLFERELDGWYVLAGGRRDFNVSLDDAACGQVRSIDVTAQIGSDRIQHRFETLSGTCP